MSETGDNVNVHVASQNPLFFFFFTVLQGLQGLSSLTRNGTRAPAVTAPGPNHRTTREVPSVLFIY